MLQLVCYFLYMGIQLSFWSGVYGPSLANTLDFDDPKALTGLHGILIGVGEIVAGLVFGVFGHVTNKYGRYPVVVLGSVLQLTSIILIVLNIPKDAVFGETTELPILGSSSEAIALACSVMLGFGDACYNTQTMSLLAGVYPDRAGPAFAIFKFVQCVAAAAGLQADDLAMHTAMKEDRYNVQQNGGEDANNRTQMMDGEKRTKRCSLGVWAHLCTTDVSFH